jgi:hypothetical protein
MKYVGDHIFSPETLDNYTAWIQYTAVNSLILDQIVAEFACQCTYFSSSMQFLWSLVNRGNKQLVSARLLNYHDILRTIP